MTEFWVPVGTQGHRALIDEEYYDFAMMIRWSLKPWRGTFYAVKQQHQAPNMYMHTWITGFNETDHIDGNGLNNKRSNLRDVTHAQNLQNQRIQTRSRSGYRGVSYFKGDGKRKKLWRARIKIDGQDTTIGYYSTPLEAAIAWNAVALDAWGEYARLNVIPTT